MSEHDDLDRDIADEDEMRSLLNRRLELDVPPFAHVTSRADGRSGLPATAAIAAAVLIVAVGVVLIRGGTGPIAPPNGSLTPASASAGPSSVPFECGLPSSLALTRHVSGNSLITSLEYVQPTDQQTNQVNWIVGFLLDRGASAPATIGVQAEITITSQSGTSFLQVLGYDEIEPTGGPLKEGDSLTLDPCKALTLQIRTAGPVRDGIFTYDVAIHKVGLPEGGTIQEHLTVELSCSSRTLSCDSPAQAQRLSDGLGAVKLGMGADDVLRAAGTPAERTVSHGLGTPEWRYSNGLTVFFRGASSAPGAVWRIRGVPPFDGATGEGVRISSTLMDVRDAYSRFSVNVTADGQIVVQDASHRTLDVGFDAGQRVISLDLQDQL